MTKISKYFTELEATHSQTAVARGIDNSFLNPSHQDNAVALATNVLDVIREALARPLELTSLYRRPEVNAAVGGARGSDHMEGRAADLRVPPGMTREELATVIYDLRQDGRLDYDQLIWYADGTGGSVHVSYRAGACRGQSLHCYAPGKYEPWAPGGDPEEGPDLIDLVEITDPGIRVLTPEAAQVRVELPPSPALLAPVPLEDEDLEQETAAAASLRALLTQLRGTIDRAEREADERERRVVARRSARLEPSERRSERSRQVRTQRRRYRRGGDLRADRSREVVTHTESTGPMPAWLEALDLASVRGIDGIAPLVGRLGPLLEQLSTLLDDDAIIAQVVPPIDDRLTFASYPEPLATWLEAQDGPALELAVRAALRGIRAAL